MENKLKYITPRIKIHICQDDNRLLAASRDAPTTTFHTYQEVKDEQLAKPFGDFEEPETTSDAASLWDD